LGIFVRRARRPGQRLGPGFDFAGDLGPPTGTIRRDLECDPRSFAAADLPAFSKQRPDHGRKSSDAATEDAGKHLRLALIGALVDEDAGRPLGSACPEIALPSSDAHEAQIAEIDVAEMTAADMPEQHRLAEAVVRGLGEGARAGSGAAAIVEPVTGDPPAWNLCHDKLQPPSQRLSAFETPSHRKSAWSKFMARLAGCPLRLTKRLRTTNMVRKCRRCARDGVAMWSRLL